MDNSEVLGHLLKIESEAAALVVEAQAEADRRVEEAEKMHRIASDKRLNAEGERLEKEYQETKEEALRQYRRELDSYTEKISALNVDEGCFSALLGKYISGDL